MKKADGSLTTTWKQRGVELVSVTPEQVQIARLAWRRYGKGNHPAGLNFGDTFAYALADVSGEPGFVPKVPAVETRALRSTRASTVLERRYCGTISLPALP